MSRIYLDANSIIFKTPDAIPLVTAIEEQVDLFLTGDKALARCVDVNVEVLAGL